MRIAFRHVARFGLTAVVGVALLMSTAAASAGATKRHDRNTSCAEVDFAPNSDNIAFNIRTAGVSCAAGRSVVDASAPERYRPGPHRSYRSGTFSCRGTFERPMGKWYEHYVCRSIHSQIAFDRG